MIFTESFSRGGELQHRPKSSAGLRRPFTDGCATHTHTCLCSSSVSTFTSAFTQENLTSLSTSCTLVAFRCSFSPSRPFFLLARVLLCLASAGFLTPEVGFGSRRGGAPHLWQLFLFRTQIAALREVRLDARNLAGLRLFGSVRSVRRARSRQPEDWPEPPELMRQSSEKWIRRSLTCTPAFANG